MADKIDYEQKCKQLDILINLLEGENKRLREQKNSVTDSDTISRQAAIETVMECYDNDELFEVYEDKLRDTIKFNINNLAYKKDVLKWYLEMNSGGTVHSDSELNRVREMIKEYE